MFNKSNTTGVTGPAGTSYPSGVHVAEFIPIVSGVRVVRRDL